MQGRPISSISRVGADAGVSAEIGRILEEADHCAYLKEMGIKPWQEVQRDPNADLDLMMVCTALFRFPSAARRGFQEIPQFCLSW
jgi:hypothetical protein